jgi:uncharacterized membrane protein
MADKKEGAKPLMNQATVRTLIAIGLLICGVSLLADAFRERHGEFGFDAWFGFYPGLGFLAGLAIIGVSKAIGALLKRPAAYYDRWR